MSDVGFVKSISIWCLSVQFGRRSMKSIREDCTFNVKKNILHSDTWRPVLDPQLVCNGPLGVPAFVKFAYWLAGHPTCNLNIFASPQACMAIEVFVDTDLSCVMCHKSTKFREHSLCQKLLMQLAIRTSSQFRSTGPNQILLDQIIDK